MAASGDGAISRVNSVKTIRNFCSQASVGGEVKIGTVSGVVYFKQGSCDEQIVYNFERVSVCLRSDVDVLWSVM